jgi:hypothetical protein
VRIQIPTLSVENDIDGVADDGADDGVAVGTVETCKERVCFW